MIAEELRTEIKASVCVREGSDGEVQRQGASAGGEWTKGFSKNP